MTTSRMIEDGFRSPSTGTDVDYVALAPADMGPQERLPLVLQLHGAMSSAAFLAAARPVYDAAWAAGVLPRAIVACPSTPTLGGFYIDHPSGPGWERLVGTEFPDRLAASLPIGDLRAAIGFSMGGYGALKLAFRDPARYRAVAALCPAIFPAETSAAAPERNRPSVLSELNRAMGRTRRAMRRTACRRCS